MKNRIAKILGFGLISLCAGTLIIVAVGYYTSTQQGVPASFWQNYKTAEVAFDGYGIPTIRAKNWEAAIEAQGFVVAADRLFQMDMMRRKASGHLSEVFGAIALKRDTKQRKEAWLAVAEAAVEKLQEPNRRYCEAYARGVNAFRDSFPGRLGMEFKLSRFSPGPWKCRDTLLILMQMAETLSSSAAKEQRQDIWRRHLSQAWQDFLFPSAHPWNEPVFGSKAGSSLALPGTEEWIPRGDLSRVDEKTAAVYEDLPSIGSNSWAVTDQTTTLLANDPHLGASVPALWYAMRIRISDSEWVVGASLPGMPGVTLGMNASLAWAFTNSGEDVDDSYKEDLDEDRRYKRGIGESATWKGLRRSFSTIKVKGEKDVVVRQEFTDIGPLTQNEDTGEWFSRKWLALDSNILSMPMLGFGSAKTWEELNAAIDEMHLPSQNVLVAFKDGRIGYRTSGLGIGRRGAGLLPKDASEYSSHDWEYLPKSERRRKIVDPAQTGRTYLATANQRIWTNDFGHHFSDDSRHARIREVIRKMPFNHSSMRALQDDTYSRYHQAVARWVLANRSELGQSDKAKVDDLVARWSTWDGTSTQDHRTFSELYWLESRIINLLLAQVQREFIPKEFKDVPYWCMLRRAWMLRLLQTPGGFKTFGFEDQEVADWAVEQVLNNRISPHYLTNRWQAQHPFVRGIPLFGEFFRVSEYPQYGASEVVVKVEKPRFGASMRLVWDVRNPEKSTWIFPVGQSGHVNSKNYRSMQRRWHEGRPLAVFKKGENWSF